MCHREAGKLLKSINAPAGVKSLNNILCEYVTLKEVNINRQHLLQSNPLAASISAVLDQHTEAPVQQHVNIDSTTYPHQHHQRSLQQQHQHSAQQHRVCQQQQQQVTTHAHAQVIANQNQQNGGLTDFNSYPAATPAAQLPVIKSMNQQQEVARSSQSTRHRKGAPPRKRKRSDGVLSPTKPSHASSGTIPG